MFNDLALAFRSWCKTPRLSLTLLACIAVAVGGAATVLTFVHGVLLRPLPFPEQDRLVHLVPAGLDPANTTARPYFSYPNFADFRSAPRSFEAIEGVTVSRLVMLTPGGAERLRGETVTPGYFHLLGLKPLHGRLFTDDEYAGRGDKAVILSHRIWTTRYAADPGLIGQPVRTRLGPMLVAGVLPADFLGIAENDGTDYWLPERQHSHPAMHTDRSWPSTLVFGRLQPGVGRAAAEAELRGVLAGLAAAHPEVNKGLGARVTPLSDLWRATHRSGLVLMLYASLFLLAIGCGNVAILLVARLVTRERELAVRLSLGAGRGRLLRLLLTESCVLAAVGGGLALLLATWLVDAFAGAFSDPQRLLLPLTLDGGALALCLGAVAVTGLGFGLLPAWIATRIDPAAALRSGGRGVAAGALQGRGGRLLVAAQTALALALLVGAALFLRSYGSLRYTDFGYRTSGLLRYQVSTERETHPTPEARAAFFRDLDRELRTLSGVRDIGSMAPTLPPWDPEPLEIRLKGGDLGTPTGALQVNQRFASPGVFSILRVPLRSGRMFGPEDRPGSRAVALVSESLARRLAPGDDALGRTLAFAFNNSEVEIVGVVADARWNGQRDRRPSGFDLFLSIEQFPQPSQGLLFDCTVAPASLIEPVRRVIVARDPTAALHWIDTLDQALDAQTRDERFWTALATCYAVSAFALSIFGLFGVLSHSVAIRTRELGIRAALGASARQIALMVVGQGLRTVALGAGAGVGLALLAGRWLQAKLHGIPATDLPSFAGSLALLALVAALACLLPAHKAAKTDPVIALRSE